MKLAKISLAAALALGTLSTASLAQSLEEAIKGVEVSGMLRYRYNRDSYTDRGFVKDETRKDSTTPADRSRGNLARHFYRANADFKTPSVDGVAMNVGLEYHVNNGIKPNTDSGTAGDHYTTDWNENGPGTSKGVRTFYATFAPMSTKTVVNVGKMRLNTPFNDTLDDRGSGILALNSDLENITFGLGVFDNISLDDLNTIGTPAVAENLGVAAAIAKFGDLKAQLWYATMTDAVKAAMFADVAYTMGDFGVAAQMINTTYESDTTKTALFGTNAANLTTTPNSNYYTAEKNSLMVVEGSANLGMFGLRGGMMASGGDGFQVLPLDNEGAIRKAGAIWFDNTATRVSFSPVGAGAGNRGTLFDPQGDSVDGKQKLSVIYLAGNVKLTDSLNIGLDVVQGSNEESFTYGPDTQLLNPGDESKTTYDFTELTPRVSYQYNKSLNLSGFYAMLKTDGEIKINGVKQPLDAESSDSEKRNRFRFQALYKF